jgi:hypothetical protein
LADIEFPPEPGGVVLLTQHEENTEEENIDYVVFKREKEGALIKKKI